MKKRPKKDDKFRSTEVGALLEAIKAEIKPILEDIPSIKNKLDGIFEQVGKNTEDIQLIKFTLKKHGELLNGHSELLNRILEELKSKVSRSEFELLEKKVASLTS